MDYEVSHIVGVLIACPRDDREPLNDLIADRSKENPRRHLSQHVVEGVWLIPLIGKQ